MLLQPTSQLRILTYLALLYFFSQPFALAQVGQSDWVQPAQSQAPQSIDSGNMGQSDWIKPELNPGAGWVPPSAAISPAAPGGDLGQSDWVRPGASQGAYPGQSSGFQQGYYPQGQPQSGGHFQVPADMFSQEPDFSQGDLGAFPQLGGEVSRNNYLPQNAGYQADQQGVYPPANGQMGGQGGFSGMNSGMQGMGNPMQNGGLDALGKAIGAVSQMGIMPGRANVQQQQGQQVFNAPSRQMKSSSFPGASLGRSVGGSVNRAVSSGVNRAVNRAINRGINRALRF